MRKLIGILLCVILVGFVFLTPSTVKEDIANDVVIEDEVVPLHLENRIQEKTVIYLTDTDFEKLYTCKTDIRKEDDNIVNLDQTDAVKIMKAAKCEDSTDALSQAYVMSVIINRLNDPSFPNSITEILEQDKQFTCLKDGRFDKEEPDMNSHIALYLIESGQVKTEYLYFEAKTCTDSWASRNRKFACEYGGTRFYY